MLWLTAFSKILQTKWAGNCFRLFKQFNRVFVVFLGKFAPFWPHPVGHELPNFSKHFWDLTIVIRNVFGFGKFALRGY